MTTSIVAAASAKAPVLDRMVDDVASKVDNLIRLALGAAVAVEEANRQHQSISPAAWTQIERIKSEFRTVTSGPFDEVTTRLTLAMLLSAFHFGRKFNPEIWEDACVLVLREASFAPPIIAVAAKRLLKQSEFVPTPAAILRESQKEFDRVRKTGFRLRAALEAQPHESSAGPLSAIATASNDVRAAWLKKGRQEATRLLGTEKRLKILRTA
jgi:hypothetical protein